ENGEIEPGISLLHAGLAAYRSTGATGRLTSYIDLLVRAHELGGKFDEGLNLLDEPLRIAEETGERNVQAELNRQKGRFLLHRGDATAAEELYRKAIRIAVAQQAKLWELRAATSLARLWGEQGKRADAWELLAPVYGWFTEGFDTPDL